MYLALFIEAGLELDVGQLLLAELLLLLAPLKVHEVEILLKI